MAKQINIAELLSDLKATKRLLELVMHDWENRSKLGGCRKVRKLPVPVVGEHGHQGNAYHIIQIEPDTHYAVLIDVHMAGRSEILDGLKSLAKAIETVTRIGESEDKQ